MTEQKIQKRLYHKTRLLATAVVFLVALNTYISSKPTQSTRSPAPIVYQLMQGLRTSTTVWLDWESN